jgi:signal transduction histidine kinase
VLTRQVLSDEARRFIAALPEIRGGVPLPPPRPYEDITAGGDVTGIHPEMPGHLAGTFGLLLRPVVPPDRPSTLLAARERRVDLVMTLGLTPQQPARGRARTHAAALGGTGPAARVPVVPPPARDQRGRRRAAGAGRGGGLVAVPGSCTASTTRPGRRPSWAWAAAGPAAAGPAGPAGPAAAARPPRGRQEAKRRSLRTGERFNMTVAYAHPDGRERWLNAQAVATQAQGGLQAWTGFVADISTERDLQARLAREAGAKKLLLASASHELRAPTHTLSLALQSIPADGLHADQRIAQDAAQTLTQLLNDVLDAARFDTGLVRLQPVEFALQELIGPLAEATRSDATGKGLQFECSIGPGVPARVLLDPLRIRQVLVVDLDLGGPDDGLQLIRRLRSEEGPAADAGRGCGRRPAVQPQPVP